ncbi:MAG: BamA/TamA family outer membrane protein [Mucilaginibacter sp.]
MKSIKYIFLVSALFCFFRGQAQEDTTKSHKNIFRDTDAPIDSSRQRDIVDIIKRVFNRNTPAEGRKSRKLNFSIVPAVGYSLSSGFAVDVSGNVAFYTGDPHLDNLSEIDAETVYDTRSQKILIVRSTIWGDANRFKLVTDLRWEKYPIDTYGLGSAAPNAAIDHFSYMYIRTYATIFKKIVPNFYAGFGYNFDDHYNISESGISNGTLSDFQRLGGGTQSKSSGVNVDLLFDNRRNPINPLNGGYASVFYRRNYQFLGSDNNWQELQLDLRRYIRVSPDNNNILGFWSISRFTTGNVPYFDLPATGSDMYNNGGRGYTEGRFRGKDMLYLESEYRFGITKNGLLGGVLFANGETFTGIQGNKFQRIAPAAGTGLRVKINKHSDTNVAIDYAFGLHGSNGFFVNLGEVF